MINNNESYKKGFLAIFLFSLIYFNSYSQNTENGFSNTPRDVIKCLLVFAKVGDACGFAVNTILWQPNALPTDADQYFHHTFPISGNPTAYLTDYYSQMSFKEYKVLGEFFPELITVPCADLSGNGTGNVVDILNTKFNDLTNPPVFAGGSTLDDFDQWTLPLSGAAKTKNPKWEGRCFNNNMAKQSFIW